MRIPNILIAASIAIGVVACSNIFQNEDAPTPYNSEDPLKAGEISLPVKPDPSFTWAPQPGILNLGGLISKTGGEPVLVVLGQGVAAGYRDGGLFREGQITSYPNLVAHQMGLTNFKQPLFERENGNGTGRLVIDQATTKPKWNEVTNNLAHKGNEENVEFKPYLGSNVNNFSIPGFHPSSYTLNPNDDLLADVITYYKNNDQLPKRPNINVLWAKRSMPIALASRFIPSGTGSIWDHIKKNNPDVGIVDVGMDVFVSANLSGGGPGLSNTQSAPYWQLEMLDNLTRSKMKYVCTTIPDVLDFPYFKLYTYKDAVEETGSSPTMIRDGSVGVENIRQGDILLPTANVVNYFNKTDKSPLTDADVIRQDEAGRPEWYNETYVKRWSREYNHPLVDFYSVYKKVLAGQYVSEDGFRIDPSFPKGNFFSSDGIYPSAIGQAVLANEVIKVFNSAYGMQIPLINIGKYALEIAKN